MRTFLPFRWIAVLILALTASTRADETPSPVTWKPDERAVKAGLYIQPKAPAKAEKVEFTVIEPSGVARRNSPVRGSLPLFRGELSDPQRIRLSDAAGKAVPVQGLATAYWPEKTIRFLCLDFLTDLEPNQEKKFTLEYGTEIAASKPLEGNGGIRAMVADGGKSVTLVTGVVGLAFKTGTDFLQPTIHPMKKTLNPLRGQAIICNDEKGAQPATHPLTIDTVQIKEQGPVQMTVHLSGHYGTERSVLPVGERNEETWRYPCSMHFRVYGGSGQVYLEHTFGYNGDEYKDFVQSYGLTIPTGLVQGKFLYGPDDKTAADAPLGVRLNQDAHDHWSLSGAAEKQGKRIGGWAGIEGDGARVLVAVREAWQNWPVAFRAEKTGELTCEMLGERPDRALDLRYEDRPPKQPVKYRQSHSMYVGEKLDWDYFNDATGSAGGSARGLIKFHELLLDFAPADALALQTAQGHQKPLVPWPGAQRFKETKALGHIAIYDNPKYEYVKEFFSVLLDTYPVVHEANGMYGWVDWGDMPMTTGIKNGRFVLPMEGGVGWSNGERAVTPYFYHYAAGGGRRFLDLGRTFVHHTLGLDTEHAGGDWWRGGYLRHDQVHWRDHSACRQGGYRGWHTYYWLSGDPEVGRLALLEGIDAPANRIVMNLDAGTSCCDWQTTAAHFIAQCCWITTGEWRYARLHHGICKYWLLCGEQCKMGKQGWEFMTIKDGEPAGNDCGEPGPLAGYWMTYGGDDLVLDWAALTGDPVAVDAILAQQHQQKGAVALYHAPEALYLGLAALTHDREMIPLLERRFAQHLNMQPFKTKGYKTTGKYANADEWAKFAGDFGLGLFASWGKNGFSINGGQALEVLYWMNAMELLANDPNPAFELPPLANVGVGKQTAAISVDGSASKPNAAEIVKYEWLVDGKSAGAGVKASLQVPQGKHYVTLRATDAKGCYATADRELMVWPRDVICQLSFGRGPMDFVEGQRNYDAPAGFGWVKGGEDLGANAGYFKREDAHGCGCSQYYGYQQNIYQVKAAPGEYDMEMGAVYRGQLSHTAVFLQEQEVVPGEMKEGSSWKYKGPLSVGQDGLVRIEWKAIKDAAGKLILDTKGLAPNTYLSYIILRKK